MENFIKVVNPEDKRDMVIGRITEINCYDTSKVSFNPIYNGRVIYINYGNDESLSIREDDTIKSCYGTNTEVWYKNKKLTSYKEFEKIFLYGEM